MPSLLGLGLLGSDIALECEVDEMQREVGDFFDRTFVAVLAKNVKPSALFAF